MLYTLVNDTLLPAEEATLQVQDLSIQRGYGVFDYFKTLKGKPLFLDDHLDRFYQSASILQLPIDRTRDTLKQLIAQLMEHNQLADSGIRITLTGGYSPDGYTLSAPNMIMTQQPLPDNKDQHTTGIHLVTYPHQRQLPAAKSIDYLMAVWLQSFVQQQQAQDVLYHQEGRVSECPRANFFIVTQNDKVVTPSHHVLKGVIRKHVIQLAGSSYAVEEREVTLDDIYKAKEAFITSTTKNILSVVNIDGRAIGTGKPGKVTLDLSQRLQQLLNSLIA